MSPAQTETERPAGHRERLLEAAIACLREKGYARTTARDLVAASGTNLASIGYHFGGKEALLNEAVAEACRRWAAEVEAATFAPEEASIAERLETSLAAVVDRLDELRPFLVAFTEAFPQAVRADELRATMAGMYEVIRARTTDLIQRGLADAGVPLSDAHARTLASVYLAVCDGLILQWLLDPSQTPRAREIIEAAGALGGT